MALAMKTSELVTMIESRNYDAVIEAVREGMDLNHSLKFKLRRMTGLEHSVYHSDWRMACIFFVGGADLGSNELAGILQMFDFSAGYDKPPVYKSLAGKESPSFDGLRVLVDENDKLSLAYLRLMEICHNKSMEVEEDFIYF